MAVPEFQQYLSKKASGQPMEDDEFMYVEYLRLSSFAKWPTTACASSTRLARSGLFYQGIDDEVRCFSCKGTLRGWTWSVSPDDRHRSQHPMCLFMIGEDTRNIPFEPYFPNAADSEAELTRVLEHLSINTNLFHRTNHPTTSPNTRPPDNNQASGAVAAQSVGNDFTSIAYPAAASQNAANGIAMQRQDSERQHAGITTPTDNNNPVASVPANSQVNLTNGHQQHVTQSNRNAARRNNRRNVTEREGNFREDVRLRSYLNSWPDSHPILPEELAAAGFYYTGISDRVQCAFCYGVLRNWEENDDAMSEHARYFPNCPFISGEETTNVPIDQTPPRDPTFLAQTLGITINEESTDDLGVMMQRPKRPDMAIESVRLKTFQRWPTQMAQSAKDLAGAGFYYTGYADNVKCFFCDGGLRNWEHHDDVWKSHARWFPKCGYIKTVKGESFIKEVEKESAKASNPAKEPEASSGRNLKKEVKARLDTATVRAVLDMGYTHELVSKTIAKKLAETGDDFRNAESLLEAIFEVEEQITNGTFVDPYSSTSAATSGDETNKKDNEASDCFEKPTEEAKRKKKKVPTATLR